MISKIFKSLYFLLIILFVISFFQIKKLPEKININPSLLNEPIQVDTVREDFNFIYRDKKYNVKPMADYELWGLVVTVNNINTWYNYYHDENTVNLKDVCVVWGPNIANEAYRDENISFKSGEWTCYTKWSGRLQKKFYSNKLSNNHLLTANEKIQEIIKDVHIGDQIHLKGSLVDYTEAGIAWYRKTSLSREDSNQTSRSGGACEVFYIDEIDILSANQPFWHLTHYWSKRIFLILIILNFLFFIASLFIERKRINY